MTLDLYIHVMPGIEADWTMKVDRVLKSALGIMDHRARFQAQIAPAATASGPDGKGGGEKFGGL